MDAGRKMRWNFIMAAISGVLAIILLSMVSEAKESARYILDKEFRSNIAWCQFLAWVCLIIAVSDLIMGIAHAIEANIEEDEEEPEEPAAQPSAGPLAAGSAVLCPGCGQMISIHAATCPFCGHKGYKGVFKEPDRTKYTGRKCIFCDRPMTEDQIYCGACGRRQD